MKTDAVSSKEFTEGIERLDASFYVNDGRAAKKQMKFCPYEVVTVKDVSKGVFIGGRFKRTLVAKPENGIPLWGISDILKSSPDDGKLISKKNTQHLEDLFIKPAWTLIARSGSGVIGAAVFANKNYETKVISEHVMRVIPDENEVKPGLLYAYLASKHGFNLISLGIYGTAIPAIEPSYVEGIAIPRFPEAFQIKIHDLVSEAAKLRVEGNRLLNEAEGLFIQTLEIDGSLLEKLTSPTEKDTKMSFEVTAANISSLTLRARNYSPRLQKIIEHLSKRHSDKLIDVLTTEPFYTGRFKRISSTSTNAIELFSQGAIFEMKPKGNLISKGAITNLSNEIVKKGTILVAAQGSLGENEIFGRAKFVWGYLEDSLVAGHAMRFIPNSEVIDEGYLYAVLSSKLWFRIFRSVVYGTNLLGFIVPMLNKMPVPRLGDKLEQEIGQKVKTAYEKLTQANEKENKAISILENEISSWQPSKQPYTATLR